MRSVFTLVITLLSASWLYAQDGWKASTARTVITPKESMWLAGYGGRDKPSEGKMHDLWAKALALQDAQGNKALFITTDVLGFNKQIADNVRKQLQAKHGISPAQVILSSSHTHSGPVLSNALVDIYPLNETEQAKIERYTAFFEQQIIKISDEALRALKPAKVFTGSGIARFQVNRRTNVEAQITDVFELKGPNDHSVPVIKVLNADNSPMAILFGYACHPTVLSGYEWSGDYPGFTQIELEKRYPTATAMYFQGAAGDQNPLPRRTRQIAEQYGLDLANAVTRVVEEPMKPLAPRLVTAYGEVDLKLLPGPSVQELEKTISSQSGYLKRWAERMLAENKAGKKYMTSYPYPVQVWMLGDQPIVSLGGEVTIEYTLKIKQMFGNNVFVAAYTNDVMAYIPSLKVWREGGYEGETSQMVYGLPSKWEPSIESEILLKVYELGKKAGFPVK